MPSGSKALPRTLAGEGALPLNVVPPAPLKMTVSTILKLAIAPVPVLTSSVKR